jgi:hypothetical protein
LKTINDATIIIEDEKNCQITAKKIRKIKVAVE